VLADPATPARAAVKASGTGSPARSDSWRRAASFASTTSPRSSISTIPSGARSNSSR